MDTKTIIYNKVSQDIVLGILKPNQKITETDISTEFGTSREPVCEVLQKLEAN